MYAQSVCSIGLPASSRTPRTCAATFGTSDASLIGARSTNQTPSGYFSSTSAPICNDKRVLPNPPMPRSVSSRVFSEQGLRLGELALAADERGDLLRQVVGCRLERAQRRKILPELRMQELVDTLGRRQVPQPDRAKITQGDHRRQPVADTIDNRLGNEYLPPMRRLHDARGPVDGTAEEIFVPALDDAEVQPGTHPQRNTRWPPPAAPAPAAASSWR